MKDTTENTQSRKFPDTNDALRAYRQGMAERIIGQKELIDGILMACIAGGHVMLEGVPGLAKTLAVKTFSELAELSFSRIQFTPDLLPSDLIGTLMYEQQTSKFIVRKGPLFANLVLADEINRSPAKVQSALLEAMAEHQVTIGDTSYHLPEPFFVLATQNPIEQEGTYTLPEAELDRFLLKILVSYPSVEEETKIVQFSISTANGHKSAKKPLLSSDSLSLIRKDLEKVSCDQRLISYIVELVTATRPLPEIKKERRNRADYLQYITFGASPRASIALALCARIHALFDDRDYVIPDDIKSVAPAVLRHRLVLSYEAGADGLCADDIVAMVLDTVPLP